MNERGGMNARAGVCVGSLIVAEAGLAAWMYRYTAEHAAEQVKESITVERARRAGLEVHFVQCYPRGHDRRVLSFAVPQVSFRSVEIANSYSKWIPTQGSTRAVPSRGCRALFGSLLAHERSSTNLQKPGIPQYLAVLTCSAESVPEYARQHFLVGGSTQPRAAYQSPASCVRHTRSQPPGRGLEGLNA